MFKKFRNKKGFTLIELLVSIALFTTILAISVPVYTSFLKSNNLDAVGRLTVSAINEAYIKSKTMEQNDQWSVHVQSDRVIVFKGNNFGARDTSKDVNYTFYENAFVSGNTEFTFSKYQAVLDSTKQINLQVDSKVITINISRYGQIGII